MCQTLADSLIVGFKSVAILSQNYRFSSVQNSLLEISVQFSNGHSSFHDSLSVTAFPNRLIQIVKISSVLALWMTQRILY